MAFGAQIRTQRGLETIANVRSIKQFATYTRTAASGSISPSGGFPAGAFVFVEPQDGGIPPDVTLTTSTLSWSPGGQSGDTDEATTNMIFRVFRF